VRTEFLAAAAQARKLFKAILPDPMAAAYQAPVAVIRVLAERIADLPKGPQTDLSAVADAVDALLDRSVGAEEYVIRAAAEGIEPDPLIDLSQIDFDVLAAKFAGRKRAETDRLASLLKVRAVSAATRNPTRFDLVDRIEELIASYNAGSLNIDEYLRRLIALSHDLSTEERRTVVEDMTEEELAIFDLLTKPDPVLDNAEREWVKAGAKHLLAHLHEKLVLDWRRKAATMAGVRTTIVEVLDQELPTDPYPPEVFDTKVQAVFDHVITAYGDDGSSVYQGDEVVAHAGVANVTVSAGAGMSAVGVVPEADLDTIADQVVERIRRDADLASKVAEQLGLPGGAVLRTIDEVIANDEDFAVEFKSTARWDIKEGKPNKAIEDGVVKTVAGFLNTDGGTLLIGVGPDRQVVGLDYDYARVKPPNGDGFVNWLTTHLNNAIGHAAVMRTRARVALHEGKEICRLDVSRSSQPVWTNTSQKKRVFFVRMNNSTRELPEGELDKYLTDRWPSTN
jgi:type I restriction enzyme R subunit